MVDTSSLGTKEINNVPKKSNKKLTVTFEKWHKEHQIPPLGQNNTGEIRTLLENGEDAGLILPYSCRAGMCGRCKAKLISGDVAQSSIDGLTKQEQIEGYILCCTATAKTDVVIKHD